MYHANLRVYIRVTVKVEKYFDDKRMNTNQEIPINKYIT